MCTLLPLTISLWDDSPSVNCANKIVWSNGMQCRVHIWASVGRSVCKNLSNDNRMISAAGAPPLAWENIGISGSPIWVNISQYITYNFIVFNRHSTHTTIIPYIPQHWVRHRGLERNSDCVSNANLRFLLHSQMSNISVENWSDTFLPRIIQELQGILRVQTWMHCIWSVLFIWWRFVRFVALQFGSTINIFIFLVRNVQCGLCSVLAIIQFCDIQSTCVYVCVCVCLFSIKYFRYGLNGEHD